MRDRLICMDDDTSNAEVIRLGAMTYYDLVKTAKHYNNGRLGKPTLLAQALGLLWNQASCFEGLQPNDPTSTMESINDAKGHSVLDFQWSPDWT